MKIVLQITFVIVIGWLLIQWLGGDGPMVNNRTSEAIVQDWQN